MRVCLLLSFSASFYAIISSRCSGLVNTVSQAVKCQHPSFFCFVECLSDRALGACGGVGRRGHPFLQKPRGNGPGKEQRSLRGPRGKPNETRSNKVSPLPRRGYLFETRRLACSCESSVGVWDKVKEKRERRCGGGSCVKNWVCVPGNPIHAFHYIYNKLNPGK